jgi:hypothetical protein
MSLRAFYSAVVLLGFALEVCLFAVLVLRRQYRIFPVFTLYIAFNLLSDIVVGLAISMYSTHAGDFLQLASLPLMYLLELSVLFEIAWNVLRPVHMSLPKGAVRIFLVLLSVTVLFGTLLAWHVHDTGNKIEDIKRPLDLTVGLLRMLIFAATAGFAQVLGIGWKNKVLQLATALSFYSAVNLIVSLGEHHSGTSTALDPLRSVAYMLEIGFLVWAFTTKEVRRREFSPQMEQFLVTLAGRARLARTVLVRMQVK